MNGRHQGAPPSGPAGSHEEPASDRRYQTYQGSRFPWWLVLFWIGFVAWGVIYALMYYLPDLKAWLAR